eukprot:6459530-Amphidinium_carterae.1
MDGLTHLLLLCVTALLSAARQCDVQAQVSKMNCCGVFEPVGLLGLEGPHLRLEVELRAGKSAPLLYDTNCTPQSFSACHFQGGVWMKTCKIVQKEAMTESSDTTCFVQGAEPTSIDLVLALPTAVPSVRNPVVSKDVSYYPHVALQWKVPATPVAMPRLPKHRKLWTPDQSTSSFEHQLEHKAEHLARNMHSIADPWKAFLQYLAKKCGLAPKAVATRTAEPGLLFATCANKVLPTLPSDD